MRNSWFLSEYATVNVKIIITKRLSGLAFKDVPKKRYIKIPYLY